MTRDGRGAGDGRGGRAGRSGRSGPTGWVLAASLVATTVLTTGVHADDEAVRRHLDAGSGLLARSQPAMAVDEYRAALAGATEPDTIALARYGLGLALARLDRQRDVIEALAPVLRAARADADARARREGNGRRGGEAAPDAGDAPATAPYRAESLLLLGEAYLRTGDMAGARDALGFARPIAGDAIRPSVLASFIEAAASLDDGPAAEGACDELERIAPNAPALARSRYLAAVTAARRGDAAAAHARLERLLDGRPEAAIARPASLLAARCLERLERPSDAARRYRAVLDGTDDAMAGDAAVALASIELDRGRGAVALEVLDGFERRFPAHPMSADATRLAARAHLAAPDRGGAARAADTIDAGLRRHDDPDGRIHWLRGRAALATDDPAAAATWFERSLEQAPTGPAAAAAAYDRAVAWSLAGDPAAAAGAANDFLVRHADHPLAFEAGRLRASSLLAADRPDASRTACAAVRAAHPDHEGMADIDLIDAEAAEATGDLDAAATAWRAFLDRHAGDPRTDLARTRLGLALHASGRDDEAAAVLAEAQTRAPGDAAASVALALGDVAVRNGDVAEAARQFRLALDAGLDGSTATATRLRLAWSARRAGDSAAAESAATEVLQADADDPAVTSIDRARAHLERGAARLELGRADDAARDLEATVAAADRVGAGAPSDDGRGAGEGDGAGDTLTSTDRAMLRDLARAAIGRLIGIASDADRRADAASWSDRLVAFAASDDAARDAEAQAASWLAADGQDAAALERFESLIEREPDDAQRAALAAQAAMARVRLDATQPNDADAAATLAVIDRALARPEARDDLVATMRYERTRRLRLLDRADEAAEALRSFLDDHAAAAEAPYARLDLADLDATAARHDAVAASLAPMVAGMTVAETGAAAPGADRAMLAAAAHRLGVAWRSLARPADAAKALDLAVQHAEDPAARVAAAAVAGESWLEAGDPARAVTHFERVEREDPDPVRRDTALLRRADALTALGRWALAEEAYADYLRRHPDDGRWYAAAFGEAWAIEQQGRVETAMTRYRRLAQTHDGPTAARAQFQYGECLFALGRRDDAAREFLKVEILFDAPLWAAAALHEAASCFEALGRSDEARATLERLVADHPETDWARRARVRLDRMAEQSGELDR